jgi:hypothetical protein
VFSRLHEFEKLFVLQRLGAGSHPGGVSKLHSGSVCERWTIHFGQGHHSSGLYLRVVADFEFDHLSQTAEEPKVREIRQV